jgi:uncharacterized repeat protein (TIGR01451 family)
MSRHPKHGSRRAIGRTATLACWLALLLAPCLLVSAGAAAAVAAPHWSIVSQSEPSRFTAGAQPAAYRLIVRNDGAAETTGEAVAVTDVLPDEVSAIAVTARAEGANGHGSPDYLLNCPSGHVKGAVTCTYEEDASQGPLPPGTTIVMTVTVSLEGVQASRLENTAIVSGGGAQSASVSESTAVGLSEAAPFGFAYFTTALAEESGEADTQAGSHPFELVTSLAFTIAAREPTGNESPLTESAPKDLEVRLPPGLVGDPGATPRCTQQEFQEQERLDCPVDSQVGTITPYFYGSFPSAVYPVYNIVPPPGQPVELGFTVAGIGHVPLFFELHDDAGGDGHEYALTAQLDDIPETGPLQGATLVLWGIPADGNHDLEREGTTGQGSSQNKEVCKPFVKFEDGIEEVCRSGVAARPFLSLPSSCSGTPPPVWVRGDTWQAPEEANPAEPESPYRFVQAQPFPPLTGCERLSISPSLSFQPENAQAGAPSGYVLHLQIPQNEDPTGLATADVRRVVVTLPPGTALSPSAGNGLQGCSEEQFQPRRLASASCPAASALGTVQITTPLLVNPLEGQVFIAKPTCEPCSASDAQEGRLLRLFVQAQGSGVTIKLEGSVAVNQATGQLTATFAEDPQLPWEDLDLRLAGGPGAPLVNASACGTPLAADAQLTAYSSETPVYDDSEPFELSGCTPPRFAPSFAAGTTDNQAGAFSPLAVTVSRTDQDEDLQRISVRLPEGLLGVLAKVPRCGEAQARAGACAAQSRIGSVTVQAGAGPMPLVLSGSVYLTGPYGGAPFGLALVVPAVAGPLDLGTIDVRATISVNPSTAALTVTSDPLPQILDGVPLQLRTVSLDVEREGFAFNPTDCERMAIEGALTSAQGTTVAASSPFQAANCATLPFKPKLSALTHARPSRTGVYLHVKILSAAGQANVAKLKVDLPKQLAARLTTLHGACAAAVFAANPAACPAASAVGSATVVTPVLQNPLRGPVYLVSRGGAATPAVEIVLQGEGVVLDLAGRTIVAHGILSAAFSSLPDAPISSFDLVIAGGAHSLLVANLPARARGSMCGQSLAMPIALTGQNGAVVKQAPRIAVSACPRPRRRARRGHAR